MPRNAVQPLDKFFNVMSLVAIVGRPNVGKSTLFNRLVGQRQAIVDSTAGTTRDRHYGKTDWNGKEFSVIDTGGYTVNSDDIFEDDIRRQVMLAIDEADVILFLVEVSTGITDLDTLMATSCAAPRRRSSWSATKSTTTIRSTPRTSSTSSGWATPTASRRCREAVRAT